MVDEVVFAAQLIDIAVQLKCLLALRIKLLGVVHDLGDFISLAKHIQG